MELIDTKSILAKLMATENLVVEQRNVRTASFDVKNRILTLPILDEKLSANLFDLFTGHEVGHALYTPMEGMKDAIKEKINMSVVNVVEDSRIERKVKYKYPGLKYSFFKAYGELIERNFFETEGKDLNEYNLIDRINLHCKVGAVLNIQFNEEERKLLDAVESTETYADVIRVSKQLIEYMKLQSEEDVRRKVITDFTEELEDGEEADGDGMPSDDEFDFDDESSEKSGIEVNQSSGETGEDSDEMNPKMKETIDRMVDRILEESIKSKTDEAFHRNEEQLFNKSKRHYSYANIPKVDMNFIHDYKDLYKKYKELEMTDENAYINDGVTRYLKTNKKEYLKFRRESEKVVSYLVKEFELRKNADQMKRAKVSKTGDLNMSKIYSYKFNEDIFKKVTVTPGGKSHGLVMFLDWSGSMAEHIANTVKQLANLTSFCKKVNIPFEVYSFVENSFQEKEFIQQPKAGDMHLHRFGLANILSSRMNSSELTYAYSALFSMAGIGQRASAQPKWLHMAGTPLNETIIAAMEIVPHFQKKYKLQHVNTVFLTDGEGGYIRSKYIDEKGNLEYVTYDGHNAVSHIVLRDPVTKREEKYSNSGSYGSYEQTKALIALLRHRTGSNVIGFYIASARELARRIEVFFPSPKNYNEHFDIKENFKRNKFLVVEDSGFDEYYILRTNGLDTDENNTFEVSESASTRTFVNAFSKYTGGKVNNRVILNRFINLIT